jgi:CO dehydrogenase/acetyl-CoA synthase epsilon subunit
MTNKEYMLKVLDLIKDIFPPAKDFQMLVEGDMLSEEMSEILLAMLKEVSASMADISDKAKLDKSIEFINRIKAQELAQHTKDEQELKGLEEMFNQI